jgi:GTP cyclohydrolase FolE2
MEDNAMAYIARCRECQAVVMATVDAPRYAEDNAKEIAQAVRQGYQIERVPVEHVREAKFGCSCAK